MTSYDARRLFVDVETFSSVPLPKSGVYAYAESDDFEVLIFGYAWDDEPAQVVDLAQDENIPDDVKEALFDSDVLKIAHNANFERVTLAAHFGRNLPPEQWLCTSVMARELGLPGSLEGVGKVIGLAEDQQKDKKGLDLIKFFSIPCKPTKTNGQRDRNFPEHDLHKWQMYLDYNRQDVETERWVFKKLARFPIIESEQHLWTLDQLINDRGVGIDLELAQKASQIDELVRGDLYREAKELTGLENPGSPAQLKYWIEEQSAFEVKSLNKKNIKSLRADLAHEKEVLKVLDIRAQLAKTSVGKYNAMIRTVGLDGRVRGLMQFCGAGRTGRWAGRLVQVQNLPRNEMDLKLLKIARQAVLDDDVDLLRFLFDNVPDVLSQLIRTAFVPKSGHKFIVADFSAIEARVIAWLADEQWRLDVFNSHGKIYEASAEQMFGLPPGSVGKGDPMRQKGKIAELALGFGGAVGALKAMGALEMGLTERELQPLVDAWRDANPAITKLWHRTDKAVRRTIEARTPTSLTKGIGLRYEKPLLRLRLPSGRELSYVSPKILDGAITYDGTFQSSGGWGRIESYGAKFCENIVQATARDCLAVGIMRLEAADLPIVFHCHDEVIVEVPQGTSSAKEVASIISEPIDWAEGLPLGADAYECEFYYKN